MNRLSRMILICALIVGWGAAMLLIEWVALELLRLRRSLEMHRHPATSAIEQPVSAP